MYNPAPYNDIVQQMNGLREELNAMPSPRPLYAIASEINIEYLDALRKGKTPAWLTYTKPYQQAMRELTSIEDRYGMESAYEIVLRFLANATSWRGETARRIKAELNTHLAACPDNKHL